MEWEDLVKWCYGWLGNFKSSSTELSYATYPFMLQEETEYQ